MKVLVPVKRVHRLQRQIRVKADQTACRTRQRQDVDEPLRRNLPSKRRSASERPESDRDDRRVDRRAAVPGNDPHGARNGRRPGILIQTDDKCEPLAVAKMLKAIVEKEEPDSVHPRQAGDRRRSQPDRPDAGRRCSAGARRPSPPSSRSAMATASVPAKSMAVWRPSP